QERDKSPETPMTPMPDYSLMETPQLKKELSRFGVRPLPKRQMVLKLKEIFQYTHQDVDMDVDADIVDDIPSSQFPSQKAPAKHRRQTKTNRTAGGKRAKTSKTLMLSSSQESSYSSLDGSDVSVAIQSSFFTMSEEEEEEFPASQAAARETETLEAVRNYILSNPALYHKILFYEPVELAALHLELKGNGIKISKAKLLDFLDAQCITFTTAAERKEK
ncbi:SLX4 endonuclease, partial [Nothoprocta pentlandii]|nr:SLX4 endonuclease [Nothoprocta pentlandii]